jgi:hypothetical protein
VKEIKNCTRDQVTERDQEGERDQAEFHITLSMFCTVICLLQDPQMSEETPQTTVEAGEVPQTTEAAPEKKTRQRRKGPPKSCNNWAENQECKYGEECRFMHGENDPRFAERIAAAAAAAADGEQAPTKRKRRRNRRKKSTTDAGDSPADVEAKAAAPVEKTTEECNNWAAGRCRFGDKCRRVHVGDIEQRPRQRRKKEKKTAPDATSTPDTAPTEEKAPVEKTDEECKNYAAGRCRFGEKCRRIHVGDVPQKPRKRKKKKKTSGAEDAEKKTEQKEKAAPNFDEPCRNYAAGRCRFGESCRRQHVGDVPQKPVEKIDEICNNFNENRCRYGDHCRRQHVVAASNTTPTE